MGTEKKMVCARLDADLVNALKIIAENENRPLSNMIETILKQYISKIKKL